MALDFIPTVWAARLLVALEKSLVYGQTNVCNRDYEGEIRASGNTVKIASIGDVTIDNYTKDTDIAEPEVLSDTDQSLIIDQAKYFNFYVDSVDRAQQTFGPSLRVRLCRIGGLQDRNEVSALGEKQHVRSDHSATCLFWQSSHAEPTGVQVRRVHRRVQELTIAMTSAHC